jgi:thiol:disulfide interchange protein
MMRKMCIAVALLFAVMVRAADPFTVTARLERANSAWQVVAVADMPPHHVLYADDLKIEVDGRFATGQVSPLPVMENDPASGDKIFVYTSRVSVVCALTNGLTTMPTDVTVQYRGCSETVCFPTKTTHFLLREATTNEANDAMLAPPETVAPSTGTNIWLAGVAIRRHAAGYLTAQDFLAFLSPKADATPRNGLRLFVDDPVQFLKTHGLVWTLILMLIGGLLLNLTPCVLPMIPINLAIIGAGARAGSRRRGFALGAAYGAGMALVYGALGLVVVLTGSVFGTLQSSPLFNAAVAMLFIVLALALFDVFPFDLSRFQNMGGSRGGWVAALVAGGISALLAGACVAPVVAAVLLLAGTLYHGGATAAVLLPFMLGVGMALPWPLAGAGLAVLPKPGAWMVWVKYGFGVLIIVLGLYYGWLAYRGFSSNADVSTSHADSQNALLKAGDSDAFREKVAKARAAGKPLLLDFQASWCKNCHAMERTTFRDPDVKRELLKFVFVHVQTEHPSEEPAAGMVQAMGVSGMPFYIVLDPQ